MSLLKLCLIWFLVATVALVAGWLMTLHGGVYFESAERVGESTIFYRLESIAGQILMWPVFGIAWLWELISPSKGARIVNEFYVLALHYFGYGVIFCIYGRYAWKRTEMGNQHESNTTAT